MRHKLLIVCTLLSVSWVFARRGYNGGSDGLVAWLVEEVGFEGDYNGGKAL